MYKCIIVDDEAIIREGLSTFLKWEHYGFQLLGCASEGQEAWDLIKKAEPDLVITDIYMPVSDGMELAAKIKEAYPNMLTVFLSGYNDFAYAQAAIEMGVYRYLSKPVKAVELESLLEDAKKELQDQNKTERQQKQLERQIKENRNILYRNFIRRYISGRIGADEKVQNSKLFEVRLQAANYMVFAAEFDSPAKLQEAYTETELDISLVSLMDIMSKKLMMPHGLVHFTQFREDEIVGLVLLDMELNEPLLRQICVALSNLQIQVKKNYGQTISIGLSSHTAREAELPRCLHEARRSLEGRIHTGANSIIHFKDIESDSYQILPLTIDLRNEIYALIRKADLKGINECINASFRLLGSNANRQTVNFIATQILLLFLHPLIEAGISIDDVFESEGSPFEVLYQKQNIKELSGWLEEVARQVIEQIDIATKNYTRHTIEKAKNYVQANYRQQDLNLAGIAENVYLSPCYLSQLFKKTTGTSLVEYITQVRIEHAKKLLHKTMLKTYQIADEVGFRDGHYFSTCFKRLLGITPTEYREQINFDI